MYADDIETSQFRAKSLVVVILRAELGRFSQLVFVSGA